MRVLAVGNMYPPHHLGGYELVWRSSVQHLRGHGHDVRVLTTDFRTDRSGRDDPGTFRELRWYWQDHDWPPVGWRQRLVLERHNHAVLRRHLDDLQPDVVSWWAMGGMSLSLIERVYRAGIPSVAFVHDEWLVYGPQVDRWTAALRRRPHLAALAERATGVPSRLHLDRAARCIFVSEQVRAHARAAGYTLPGSTIAPSGIDADLFAERPEAAWRWRLLYIGRIDERKGISDAVAALADLPGATRLTVIGAGDERTADALAERSRQLAVSERILWAGMADRQALPDMYAAADAVLFPVRWEEPWGLVPLEAMAVGRPVIATGKGGSAEYLRDGVNCLVVPPATPQAIAHAVRRLAEEPELRARLREGGFQTARRFTQASFDRRVLAALTSAANASEVVASRDVAA